MDDVLIRNKILNALNSRSAEMLMEVVPNLTMELAEGYISRWVTNYDETRQGFYSDNSILREYQDAEAIIDELVDKTSSRTK